VQSWSCAGRGGSNVGQYCDPAFDSLVSRAASSTRKPRGTGWRAALRDAAEGRPGGLFLASPIYALRRAHPLPQRDAPLRVVLQHDWRWSVDPARRIGRDGPASPR
jgi:hypothetical protein